MQKAPQMKHAQASQCLLSLALLRHVHDVHMGIGVGVGAGVSAQEPCAGGKDVIRGRWLSALGALSASGRRADV